ncbi:MAG: glycoside hydrolase family 32 protein [Lachnospiraceae bacterium]|jgi:sucrose-6-phosphate hydrolase|nr:glycoside hydrolase family 32 protein [Lachnospiraceae bacterium]MCI8872145.1 glycoside hydrolase family 32 protein [Lachnospiraceae bacterium]GFI32260.1 sucrose-6-phosphate hydrolase [Lachnospiraceae bacterium]
MSQTLRDARRYEEITEKRIEAEEKPGFHLAARVGWMNDPNGFSFYGGEYHLFYQYHPYNSHWGPMHWGHAVSDDLLHWTYLPAALAPDTIYDEAGCFSGSAVELSNGRQLLMYTGVHKEVQADGGLREVQTQCIAIGDGRDYEKYQGNPVLDEKDLPDGGSKYDFRDPKMWKAPDGTFRCVVGNCAAERDGQILLFSSRDGLDWKYEKVLAVNHGRFGKAWECPDFFELDGKQVLLTSPMDMLPKGLEYHNGNGTLCLIGTYDETKEVFTEEQNQAVDYGIDFYAPQTLLAPDGRRIMVGWMQNWDTCNLHSPEQPWFGQMSLPRELSVVDGRLLQKPIRELENLRGKEVKHENVTFSGLTKLDGIQGRKIDMELSVRPLDEENMYRKFAVRFAQNNTYHTAVSFRPLESIVKIDRKFSGSRRAIIHQRRSRVNSRNGEIKLRIILDTFSAEVFVNDGEHVLSATIYTDKEADGISFLADGVATIDVVKYDLLMEERK